MKSTESAAQWVRALDFCRRYAVSGERLVAILADNQDKAPRGLTGKVVYLDSWAGTQTVETPVIPEPSKAEEPKVSKHRRARRHTRGAFGAYKHK